MKVSTLLSISEFLKVPVTELLQDEGTFNNEVDRVFETLKEMVKQKML